MLNCKTVFLSFCIFFSEVAFGENSEFQLIPGQELQPEQKKASESGTDHDMLPKDIGHSPQDLFFDQPEQEKTQNTQNQDNSQKTVETLQREVEQLKNLVLSQNKLNNEQKVGQNQQTQPVKEEKVYDKNFDSIKDYQDKLKVITDEFEGKLNALNSPLCIEMIKKSISALPKEITNGSSVQEELLEDLGNTESTLENLLPKIQAMTALLYSIEYLVCDYGLIEMALNKAHNEILDTNSCKSILEQSVGNIKNFIAQDFINSMISLVLKSSGKENVPSYFVFNFVNCLVQLVVKEKAEVEAILQEFSRKCLSISRGLEDIIKISKSKSTSPEIPEVNKPFFESEAKSLQSILEIFQKSEKEFNSSIEFKSSCLNRAEQILKSFANSKKDDAILMLIQ